MQHKNNTPVNKSVYNLFATGCCVYMTATFLDLNLQRIISQAEEWLTNLYSGAHKVLDIFPHPTVRPLSIFHCWSALES